MKIPAECFPPNVIEFALNPTGSLFKASAIAVFGWSLIEATLQLGVSMSSDWLFALAASKILMGLIGTVSIVNLHLARQVTIGLCGVGLSLTAPALPLEYIRYCLATTSFPTFFISAEQPSSNNELRELRE
jgi:hypothetical protein